MQNLRENKKITLEFSDLQQTCNLSTDTLEGKYLTFWTDKQLFGIPIRNVVQIVSIQEITAVPEYPRYAKGVINLRGNIIPIIDVRCRFHKEEIPYTERTCIIVTNINEVLIGFAVDSVDEVIDIPNQNISVPPKISNAYENNYLNGIGKIKDRVALLLDAHKILTTGEIDGLNNTLM